MPSLKGIKCYWVYIFKCFLIYSQVRQIYLFLTFNFNSDNARFTWSYDLFHRPYFCYELQSIERTCMTITMTMTMTIEYIYLCT